MISQTKIRFIRSLDNKKGRQKENAFVAEGPKVVGDLMNAITPRLIVATGEWLEANRKRLIDIETIAVTDEELRKASLLQHPQQVIGVFPLPAKRNGFSAERLEQRLYLALDGVQDPGNLGTIIRIADWFGIEDVLCSRDTVDAYNPKVVQATMGSLARVIPQYVDLENVISAMPKDYPVYGMLLDGNNIYNEKLTACGMIVMGNEGKGISQSIRKLVNHRLLIPNWPQDRTSTDSLNVAIATAITCAEFRRRATGNR